MDYKVVIIEGYNGRETTPYVSHFTEQAKLAHKNLEKKFVDFFFGCKYEINKMINQVKVRCDDSIKQLDSSIEYWKNFIVDDKEWENTVIKRGGFNGYYNQALEVHQKEKLIDRDQKIQELEREKEQWAYDKFSFTFVEIKISIPYPMLVEIGNAIIAAEQELSRDHNLPETTQTSELAIIPAADDGVTGNDVKQKRTIDAESLKIYFISSFKGIGNGSINNFDTLIDELKTDRPGIEFAKIALMIFDSNKLNARKPNTFSKWYRIFCECIGVIPVKGYKPNKLKNQSEKLKKLFSYI